MGRIFCIVGKSSSGKDTIYKRLIKNNSLNLDTIVSYTTRPIRAGEQEGVEYHFTTLEELEKFKNDNKIIECRSYNTVHGIWHYFIAKDSNLQLDKKNYLVIGTLESYIKLRDYFGKDKVIPIYIVLEDGERLERAIRRERIQDRPNYEELCRRFIADARDFSTENLNNADIIKGFDNYDLEKCLQEIIDYINSFV